MTDLSGRVVVVTGGNRGIGLGIARACAEAGASVALWARDEERNAAAVAELATIGPPVAAFRCDVAEEQDVDAAMTATVERLGRLDAMVANAGIGGGGPFAELTLDAWRRVQRVNLDGAFLTLRAATRQLLAQGEGGALVSVSSVSAIHGAPGMQSYAAAKAGLLAMTRGLAVELARHAVRVNALLPGWTDTEMLAPMAGHERFVDATVRRTPARRWGLPSDMGAVAAFLADPTLTFHTGDCLVVDGGYTVF